MTSEYNKGLADMRSLAMGQCRAVASQAETDGGGELTFAGKAHDNAAFQCEEAIRKISAPVSESVPMIQELRAMAHRLTELRLEMPYIEKDPKYSNLLESECQIWKAIHIMQQECFDAAAEQTNQERQEL